MTYNNYIIINGLEFCVKFTQSNEGPESVQLPVISHKLIHRFCEYYDLIKRPPSGD